jgi:hypothetical protein
LLIFAAAGEGGRFWAEWPLIREGERRVLGRVFLFLSPANNTLEH